MVKDERKMTFKTIKQESLKLAKKAMLKKITYEYAFNKLFFEIHKVKVPKTLNIKDKLI